MRGRKRVVFDEFRTLIGEDVRFKGDIESKEDMLIAGNATGTIVCEKTIHFLKSASAGVQISTRNCTMYGATLDGRLTVSERLKIYRGSDVKGRISAGILDVEGGAIINATVAMARTKKKKLRNGADVT